MRERERSEHICAGDRAIAFILTETTATDDNVERFGEKVEALHSFSEVTQL